MFYRRHSLLRQKDYGGAVNIFKQSEKKKEKVEKPDKEKLMKKRRLQGRKIRETKKRKKNSIQHLYTQRAIGIFSASAFDRSSGSGCSQ